MSSSIVPRASSYDGEDVDSLAGMLGVPAVIAYDSVSSTLDVAHDLGANGAASGTLVLADTQSAGRGRAGKPWASQSGAGIWLTIVERQLDAAAIEVLALRLGLAGAVALEPFVDDRVLVKWPNDLYVGDGKLSGILVEARWRAGAPEWVAVGIGVNMRLPDGVPNAAALRAGVRRADVLVALVPALRGAARRSGSLDPEEHGALASRDMARGRRVDRPGTGTVEGVSAHGELLVRTAGGTLDRYRAGSLVFAEES